MAAKEVEHNDAIEWHEQDSDFFRKITIFCDLTKDEYVKERDEYLRRHISNDIYRRLVDGKRR